MSNWSEQDIFRLAEWGYGCYQQCDLRRVRILFAAVLEARPTDSYSARGLAGVAIQEGRADEAVELMARVLKKSPQDLPARLRLVESLIAAGRIEEAHRGIASIREKAREQDLLLLELRLLHAKPAQATSSADGTITSA